MKRTFRVHETAQTIRLTRDLVTDGFSGDLAGYSNSCVLVLIKPNINQDTVTKALKAIITDMELREMMEQKPSEV